MFFIDKYIIDQITKLEKIQEKVSKKAKIANRYNQKRHLTQDSTWKSEETQDASHPPVGLDCCTFLGGGSVVVDILFNVLSIVCGCSVFVFVLL